MRFHRFECGKSPYIRSSGPWFSVGRVSRGKATVVRPLNSVVRQNPNIVDTLPPSPLESALLKEFHALYNGQGFPEPRSIAVVGRTNTGGGRYVQLHFDGPPMSQSGYLDLGGKFIQMEGLPNGMMAVALVKDGRLAEIEIAVYGGDHWDGHERGWSIQ